MALDVFVGSLSRYYAAMPASIEERPAREQGRRFPIMHRDLQAQPAEAAERLYQKVVAWRAGLNRTLGISLEAPLDWDESPTAAHFTARPGWDGFGSLVLWTAYAEHPALQRPNRLREEWENDAALARSTAEGFRSRYPQILRNVELWLPSSFQFAFDGEDVSGRRIVMGSVLTLRRQLDELNGATWKAGVSAVDGWRQVSPAGDASLEQCARFGFAVMADAAQQAIDRHMPMKLDY